MYHEFLVTLTTHAATPVHLAAEICQWRSACIGYMQCMDSRTGQPLSVTSDIAVMPVLHCYCRTAVLCNAATAGLSWHTLASIKLTALVALNPKNAPAVLVTEHRLSLLRVRSEIGFLPRAACVRMQPAVVKQVTTPPGPSCQSFGYNI